MVEQPAKTVDDRQSQAKSSALTWRRRAHLVEFSEDVSILVFGEADAAVPHLYAHALPATAATDDDATMGCIPYCVRHKVEQDPLEQNGVAADPGTALRDVQA